MFRRLPASIVERARGLRLDINALRFYRGFHDET
jgi:hypothetical protein